MLHLSLINNRLVIRKATRSVVLALADVTIFVKEKVVPFALKRGARGSGTRGGGREGGGGGGGGGRGFYFG